MSVCLAMVPVGSASASGISFPGLFDRVKSYSMALRSSNCSLRGAHEMCLCVFGRYERFVACCHIDMSAIGIMMEFSQPIVATSLWLIVLFRSVSIASRPQRANDLKR